MENQGYEELYLPSKWCVNRKPETAVFDHIRIITEECDRVKADIEHEKDVRYGPLPNQLIDIYGNNILPPDAPTFVFVHGGYWQELSKNISCYCVKPFIEAGIRVIIAGYDLAPKVRIKTIISEIQELASFISKLSKEKHWKKIWFAGHSAGAHLISCVLCSGLAMELDISGFVLISGVFDLNELLYTSINKKLKLKPEEADQNSPMFMVRGMQANFYDRFVLIFTGQYDSPAFQKQSHLFAEALKKLNIKVEDVTVNEVDHFDIVENLKFSNYQITNRIIQHIKQII